MATVLVLVLICLASNVGSVRAAAAGYHDIPAGEVIDNETVEVLALNKSQYCFVDVNTIRVYDAANMNITEDIITTINVTEGVIIATTTSAVSNNDTVFLIVPVNASWCSDNNIEDDYFSIKLYIIQIIILVCITLASLSNITLHLLHKDLLTVLGVLVMIMCASVTGAALILISKTTYRIIQGANENIVLCVVFFHVLVTLLFIYQATKLTILFHFVSLMYHSYRMRSIQVGNNVKHTLVKYITFILVSSVPCSLLMALTDFIINGEMYNVKERYCIFQAAKFSGIYNKMFHGEMTIFILLEIILSVTGLTFYIIVSKKCFQKRSTNIKVIIALATIVGINIIINTILGILHVPMNIILPAVTSGTLLEQMIILILFSLSSKVHATNCKCHAGDHMDTNP